ncbi:MAG TPA: hypothetical protein VEL31_02270 [Ktedonobacteraceae bacterium]|nr:hypothetical protein [Ktedonobacteraceae bacterium]
MGVYDVALWRRFQAGEIPYSSEAVEADLPFEAVLSLMEEYHLKQVAYAAARSHADGVINRWIVGCGFWMVIS